MQKMKGKKIKREKQMWRHENGGVRVAAYIGAYGGKPSQCETASSLLMLAAQMFQLPATTCALSQAAAILNGMGRPERRVRAASFRRNMMRATNIVKFAPQHFDKRAVPTVSQQKLSEFYESWEWKRLRYDFIKGKLRCCECCGASPKNGTRIVVDHIKPIRHFWDMRLDQSNLQLLCDDCNMGKGSRDLTAWS